MRPPGRLRPVPGWGVPGRTAAPLPPCSRSCGMTSATGFGAVAMETGGRLWRDPILPRSCPWPGLFLANVYLCPGRPCGRAGPAGGLPGKRLAWHSSELGSTGGKTSCPTSVQQFRPEEGIDGCGIWGHAGDQSSFLSCSSWPCHRSQHP